MKKLVKLYGFSLISLLMLVLLTVAAAVIDSALFPFMLAASAVGLILAVIAFFRTESEYSKFVTALEQEASPKSRMLSSFSFPVVYTDKEGIIVWYNSRFAKLCTDGCYGEDITQALKLDEDKLLVSGYCETAFGGRQFTAYRSSNTDASAVIYYLIDNTALKKAAVEYGNTRPVIMTVTIDNFYEVTKNCRDSERSEYRGAIHREIENWLSDIPCVILNQSGNALFVYLEERDLRTLISGKFGVLKRVRALKTPEEAPFTLSIGVGRGGKTPADCQKLSVQAVEMAQSRGGDQAVVKSGANEFMFFGGVSNIAEKHTKVRVRAVASALYRMMQASDKIYLMGHRYSDVDCLGACYALSCLARKLNKPTQIVFNSENTLALPLYRQILNTDSGCKLSSEVNFDDINDRTLLIVCDVHRPDFVENKQLYEKCKNVVVIDHHRKAVDAIDNAVVFYHETATSSACEMVTELLQYIDNSDISPLAANGLLGGIVLDTKSFCFHTGIRTFEAAAHLRSCGADTTAVKKLFADDMRTFVRKSAIISSAQLFEDCAVSYDEVSDNITRIATSQAADELLYLENVRASFVMCKIGDTINISARSFGDINVQIIMELLGGGGHRNMAACQLECNSFETAKDALLGAIKQYKQDI